jgi:uncharacterized Zn-binding protein involved in type VI secretion
MQPLIVVGDKTSHGGVVIDGSPGTDIDGKKVARVGDHATCPKKGHGSITVIATGDPTLMIDGAPAARHGDKTACGATLLSSQVTTTDGAGGSPNTAKATSNSALSASAMLANAQKLATTKYDLHFLVKDEKNGRPLSNVPYRLTLETGQEISGVTDQNGRTQTIAASSAVIAKLEAPFYGNSSSSSHPDDGHSSCSH